MSPRLQIILVLLFLGMSATAVAQTEISGVRSSDADETTRVVFDLGGAVEHEVFTLKDPHRVVIDIAAASAGDLALPEVGVVQRLRTGSRGDGVRLVLDVSRQVRPRSFLVAPGGDRGHRLVVDLEPHGPVEPAGDRAQTASADSERGRARGEPTRSMGNGARQRDLVVAIDAGHGGVDPGAIGPKGTFEKDIVLQVSRRLARLLEDTPGLKPLMIREGDYYMGLRDRTRKARDNNADLFVSIHADALDNPSVRGSSVYVLSEQGATSEAARMLAQRENAADFIGGVSLKDKDDMVASVLVDLSRAATVESSLELADKALEELGRTNHLLRGHRVEQAGFAVLKSLDMPSMLVELGFISNAEEERLLKQSEHQQNLARALARSIERYAEDVMLPELRMAGGDSGGTEYVVQRGDTLSGIAQRHEVSVSRIRSANDLNGDNIVVGRTLVIP